MNHSPSWEVRQETPLILSNQKVHHHLHQSPPFVSIMSQKTCIKYICVNLFVYNKEISFLTMKVYFCGAATQCGSWPPHSWGGHIHGSMAKFTRTLNFTKTREAEHLCNYVTSDFLRYKGHELTPRRRVILRNPAVSQLVKACLTFYGTRKHICSTVAMLPNEGHGLLILEVSRSRATIHQSVGLLWTSDRLIAETSVWHHITVITNISFPSGIRTHNLNKPGVADRRLRPRGHWDRHPYAHYHV